MARQFVFVKGWARAALTYRSIMAPLLKSLRSGDCVWHHSHLHKSFFFFFLSSCEAIKACRLLNYRKLFCPKAEVESLCLSSRGKITRYICHHRLRKGKEKQAEGQELPGVWKVKQLHSCCLNSVQFKLYFRCPAHCFPAGAETSTVANKSTLTNRFKLQVSITNKY